MKKILLTMALVISVMCLFAITAFAAVEINGIWYNLNGSNATASVTNDNATKCTLTDVVIPETVEYEGATYTVTTIDYHAFSGSQGGWGKNQTVKTMVIPATVTSIGSHFLRECKSIERVIVNASDTSLDNAEFYLCTSLKYVDMSNSKITTFGNTGHNFFGCSSLEEILLPPQLEKISSKAFEGCRSLTSFIMPDTVTRLEGRALHACSNIKTLKLSANLEYIGSNCIQGLAITELVLPHTIKTLASHSIPQNGSLKIMYLPEIDESESIDSSFLYSAYIPVIIYAGDEASAEWIKANKSNLNGYTLLPFSDFDPTAAINTSKRIIYYGATTCDKCNGRLTDEGFNFTSLTEIMFTGSTCTNCEKQNIKESYKAVFECLGYSKSLTTGAMVQGFVMNNDSVTVLENNGYDVGNFGVLAVSVDALGGSNTAFDSDGNAKNGVVYVNGSEFVYDVFQIKVTNIPLSGNLPNGTAYTDALIYMCAFVEFNGVINYISGGTSSEVLTDAVSYNSISNN